MKSGAKKGVTMFVYDSHVWSDQLTIKGGSHNNKVFQFSMKQNIKESWMSFLRLCRPQWAGWVKIYERHVTTASAQVSSPNRPRCATQDFLFLFLFQWAESSKLPCRTQRHPPLLFTTGSTHQYHLLCVYRSPPPFFFLSQPTPTASFQRERKEKKNRNQEREVNVHLNGVMQRCVCVCHEMTSRKERKMWWEKRSWRLGGRHRLEPGGQSDRNGTRSRIHAATSRRSPSVIHTHTFVCEWFFFFYPVLLFCCFFFPF